MKRAKTKTYTNWWIVCISMIVGVTLFYRGQIMDGVQCSNNSLKRTTTTKSEPEIMASDSMGLLIVAITKSGEQLKPELVNILWDAGDAYVGTSFGRMIAYPKNSLASIKAIRVSNLKNYKEDIKKRDKIITALKENK